MLESKIRKLIKLLEESESISEIEVSSWRGKIRISKRMAENNHSNSHKNSGQELLIATPAPPQPAPVQSQVALQPPIQQPISSLAQEKNLVSITSPVVVTFYRAPAPGAKLYVEVGEEVKLGQVVCIVEAMKLMNEIESDLAGRIIKICAENAQAVEFGQELFLVEPA